MMRRILSLPTIIVATASLFYAVGCSDANRDVQDATNKAADRYFRQRAVSEESKDRIVSFCGDCHEMPLVENFPVDAWKEEVERGFKFYDMSRRSDLERPNLYDTIAYFTRHAPERDEYLNAVKPIPSTKRDVGTFELLTYSSERTNCSAANVEFIPGVKPAFVVCNMRDGNVYLHPADQPGTSRVILKVQSPVNSTLCDFDQDGITDILVADIGDYRASDSHKGQVVLLRGLTGPEELNNGKPRQFETRVLAKGLGRICQTVCQDLDGDGQQDILIAEFGYFNTGGIYWLKHTGQGFGESDFRRFEIDDRHGTVRLEMHDFDGDGDSDFVAAIAQEYETVELFLNDGQGNFRRNTLFSAGYPSYGSSGLELVDLDQDGDTDVLYTNGDTFDSMLPKRYHSIQWLRNDGNLRFSHLTIAKMPGVHCARAADFDGDGDLDIVASAFMSNPESDIEFDALLLLTNNGNQEFTRSWIEKRELFYPNLKVADFNRDGRPDIAAGTAAIATDRKDLMPLKIYLNAGRK